jgi:type IV pilus assembly protein PilE
MIERASRCGRRSPIQRQRAFTLLELLITVTVVGILAGVALPSYQQYVRRATRAQAMLALSDIALRQERFHLDNGEYAASLGDIGFAPGGDARYAYALDDVTAQGFTAIATAVGPQLADADCRTFKLGHDGMRESRSDLDAVSTGTCWR